MPEMDVSGKEGTSNIHIQIEIEILYYEGIYLPWHLPMNLKVMLLNFTLWHWNYTSDFDLRTFKD